MTLRVPTWALAVLAAVLLAAGTVGLAVEGRPWADDHAYLINVLSSVTGFASSGLFAALVLDRARRARYRDVELNRRTQTLNDIDVLLRSLSEAFASNRYGPDAAAALATHARHVATAPVAEDEKTVAALVDAVGPAGLTSREGYPDGGQIAARFAFVGDSRIDLQGDRLDRKTRELRLSLAALASSPAGARCAADAYERAAEVAAAAVDIRRWLYDAPSASMRRAVEQRAYRSDL